MYPYYHKKNLSFRLKFYHKFTTFEKEYEIHKKRIISTVLSAAETMRSTSKK